MGSDAIREPGVSAGDRIKALMKRSQQQLTVYRRKREKDIRSTTIPYGIAIPGRSRFARAGHRGKHGGLLPVLPGAASFAALG